MNPKNEGTSWQAAIEVKQRHTHKHTHTDTHTNTHTNAATAAAAAATATTTATGSTVRLRRHAKLPTRLLII